MFIWNWIKTLPVGRLLKPFWKRAAKAALAELAKRIKAKVVSLVDDDTDASIKAINAAFDGIQEKAAQALNFVKFIPAETRDALALRVKEDGDKIQADAVAAIKSGGPAALAKVMDSLEARLAGLVDAA